MEAKEAKKKKAIEEDEKPGNSTARETSSDNHASGIGDEIDLAELISKVWKGRVTIFITVAVCLAIGILIAAISPEEFESGTTLLPESSNSMQTNRNSSLIRQFGGFFDMGSSAGGAVLGTNMYPNITQSTPFYLHIMEQEVYFSSLDTTLSVLQYFSQVKEPPLTDNIKRYTIGLPNLLLSLPDKWFKKKPVSTVKPDSLEVRSAVPDDKPLKISSTQNGVISELKSRIMTTIEKDGTVKVITKMPDPYASAELADLAVDYLTDYVIEYRTEKVQQDLAFTERQFREAERRFLASQEKLASFRDRNTNIATARAQSEMERLQTEFNLTTSVYQSLAQQLEQAKIKVQEETPVFKELEPVQIPLKESEPNRKLIILAFIFLGIVIGFCIIFARIFIEYIKNALSLKL